LQDDYSGGYVFCELALDQDQRTAVRGLIAAMRQGQVIPKALLFDNGSPLKRVGGERRGDAGGLT
jgi:hypothetical protein